MIDLGNRRILGDGTVLCDDSTAVEMLYMGLDLDGVIMLPSDDVDLYNRSNGLLDYGLPRLETSESEVYGGMDWFQHWLTPEPYASMDIEALCISRCEDDQQSERVRYEMRLFEERGMLPVLRHLVHMVDRMREEGITWGVGRGSSVSSYVLFLIGINRIDPISFGLDVREFLK